MFGILKSAVWLIALTVSHLMAHEAVAADAEFPFGKEMTLDAAPMRGSKRLPTLDIGANGEASLGLWCAEAKGQFSVAADTVIFIPGATAGPNCTGEAATRDAALLSDLAQVTNWQMSGEVLVLTGPKTLRYRVNTN